MALELFRNSSRKLQPEKLTNTKESVSFESLKLAFLTRIKVALVHNIQREGQIYSYASSNMQKSCCHANRKNDLKLLHRYMKLQSNKLLFMLGRDRAALCYKCEAKLVIYKSW